MIPPQDPVGVSQPHAGHDGRPVDEASRAVQRLHVEPAALHQQLAVLRLDAQPW